MKQFIIHLLETRDIGVVYSNGNLTFQTYSRQMVKVQQPLATLPVSVSSVYVLERRPGNGHGEMWLTLLAPERPSKGLNGITLKQSFYPSVIFCKFFFVVLSACIVLFKIHIYILIDD